MFFRKNKSLSNKIKSKISEEDFINGIQFKAKFIGSMEINRPDSRVEIVSAMRKARESFKMNKCKKYVVEMNISIDGVKTLLHRKKKKNNSLFNVEILSHSISRIYYVSQDSRDLKIFSYISSDHSSQLFKCNVFKSFNKKTSIEIVKTIGLSFDVCHTYENENTTTSNGPSIEHISTMNIKNYEIQRKKNDISNHSSPQKRPNSAIDKHESQIAHLNQQVRILQDHLNAETQSRIDAQLQNRQLLHQNEVILKQLSDVISCFSSLTSKNTQKYLSEEIEYKNTQAPPLQRSYSTNKTMELKNLQKLISDPAQTYFATDILAIPHNPPKELADQQQSPDSGHEDQMTDLVRVKLCTNDSWGSNFSVTSSNVVFSATDVEPDDIKEGNLGGNLNSNDSSVYVNDFYDKLHSFEDIASFKYLHLSDAIFSQSFHRLIGDNVIKVGDSPAKMAELTIVTPVRNNFEFNDEFCVRSERKKFESDDSNYIFDENMRYSFSEGCLVRT